MYVIYGKPNCPNCVAAKNLCENKGVEYEYKIVGVDVTVDDLRAMCATEIRSVPQVFLDSVHVGGFEELKEILI